jgi:hypothetical protein
LAGSAARRFRLDATMVRETRVMGYSLANLCVVRTVDGLTDVLQTFTHEVGHGVGQTVRTEPRWDPGTGNPLAADINPNWHTDPYGGRGDHCTTCAALTDVNVPPGLTTGQVYAYSGAGTLCTMFFKGESHVDPDGKFCTDACVDRLKRVNCNSATMGSTTGSRPRYWNYIG